MIKLKIFMTASLLFMFSSVNINANVNELPEDFEENMNALNSLNEFRSTLPDMYSDDSDVYAGAWIDSENIPHIAFTSRTNLEKSAKQQGIEIENFKHSYQDLLNFQKTIHKADLNVMINSSGVKEETNSLEINYYDEAQLDQLRALVNSLNVNEILVNYVYDPVVAISMYGEAGSQVHNNSTSCSVGFPARRGSQKGFVTSGHCFALGTQTNYGPVTYSVFNANSDMDAQFISATSALSIPWKNVDGRAYTSISSYNAAVGAYAYKATYQLSTTGKITSINQTTYYSGEGEFSNMIRISSMSLPGDSGSAVISNSAAIGITKGSNSSTTDIIKTQSIVTSLGLSVY